MGWMVFVATISLPPDGLELEIARWQMDASMVQRGYLAAKQYRDSVPVLVALDPRLSESLLREDAAWRLRIWDELDNVVRLHQVEAISRLRKAMGDEAWVLQRLPPPTPWGFE